MNMNFSIQRKLNLGFGVQVLISVALGIAAVVGLSRVSEQFEFVVLHDAPVVSNARQTALKASGGPGDWADPAP